MAQIFFIVISLLYLNINVFGQNVLKDKFGKGLNFIAKDSSFSGKVSMRMQNTYTGTYTEANKPSYKDKFELRRARLKMDGYAFSPKVTYKFEIDLVGGFVRDALISYNFFENFSVSMGQSKLAGNRERVISSQDLQFVDRSQLNAKFNIDRDKGVQLKHHFTIGQILIREIVSYTQGEGMNYNKNYGGGSEYLGRIEFLPFGAFSKKGDYSGGDLAREKKPKLSLASTVSMNDNAGTTEGGKSNSIITTGLTRDVAAFFADMMFKYNGFSMMAEYAKKTTRGSSVATDHNGITNIYYTGTAYNIQMGYLLKNNLEFALRFTHVLPEFETGYEDINEYTFGVSKYFVEHNLKIQSDCSLNEPMDQLTGDLSQSIVFRLQTELAF